MSAMLNFLRPVTSVPAEILHRVSGGRIHHIHSRYIIGLMFMGTGSSLPHLFHESHLIIVIIVECTCGFLHGTGMVPFADHVVAKLKLQDNNNSGNNESVKKNTAVTVIGNRKRKRFKRAVATK